MSIFFVIHPYGLTLTIDIIQAFFILTNHWMEGIELLALRVNLLRDQDFGFNETLLYD